MGKEIHMPDAMTVSRVEPHRRFIGLVVLLAARDGACRVRFEPRPDGWGVFAGMADRTWKEYVPVAAEAAVDRTVRTLSRSSWAAQLKVRFWAAAAPPAFEVRLKSGV